MRNSYFDVMDDNAINIMKADTKKTSAAREVDVKFIYGLRLNMFVGFGERDWEQIAEFTAVLHLVFNGVYC